MGTQHFVVKTSSSVWEEDFWETTDHFDEQVEAEKYILDLPKDTLVLFTRVTKEEACVLRDHIFEGHAGDLLAGNSR
jgi:hypothetical protein